MGASGSRRGRCSRCRVDSPRRICRLGGGPARCWAGRRAHHLVRAARGGLLIRRLVLGTASSSVFPVAGLAGNAFGFPLIGHLLVELVDDVLQLLSAVEWVLVGCRHIASVGLGSSSTGPVAKPYPAARLVIARGVPQLSPWTPCRAPTDRASAAVCRR